MYRGLVGILAGVCVGVIGVSFLALFVMVSPLVAAIFGLFFAVPYVLILMAGLGYSNCRVTLWGLIVAATLMGGPATMLRGWAAYNIVTQPPAPPPPPGTRNCGPPLELLACLLVLPENVAAPFLIVMAVGVGVAFGRD
jgi:hypothetical protein